MIPLAFINTWQTFPVPAGHRSSGAHPTRNVALQAAQTGLELILVSLVIINKVLSATKGPAQVKTQEVEKSRADCRPVHWAPDPPRKGQGHTGLVQPPSRTPDYQTLQTQNIKAPGLQAWQRKANSTASCCQSLGPAAG